MTTMKSSEPCYIWKLPSISSLNKQLLCDGYARIHYPKYIIAPIIQLFAHFYSNDPFSLTDIINAETGKRFHGPIISINSFKFYFELYPNGTTRDHKGQLAAFFCIASLPPNVSSISLSFGFQLNETNSKIHVKSYSYDMDTYWRGIYSQTHKLKDVKSLTFDLFIDKLIANYKNGEKLIIPAIDIQTNQIKEHKPELFLWEVTDIEKACTIQNAPCVFGFASPVFIVGGIKWYLTFYPNGSKIARKTNNNVYLHLAALPKTKIKVNIRHSQGLQGDIHMRSSRFITVFDIDKSSWGLIEKSTYSTKDLIHLNNFLCVAEIIMLDIYDNQQICTDEYVHHDVMSYNLKMHSYEWKLNQVMMDYIRVDQLDIEYASPVFKIFELEWKILFYPCGKSNDKTDITIGLKLLSLPETYKTYTISIRCTFDIIELNVRYITTGFFDENELDIDWGNGRVLNQDIKNLKHCTIKIGMELVDIYENGVCITNNLF